MVAAWGLEGRAKGREVLNGDHISVVVSSLSRVTLGDPVGRCPPGSLCSWDSIGKNTGVGCHFLPQGVLPTQRSSLCLLLGRLILYR